MTIRNKDLMGIAKRRSRGKGTDAGAGKAGALDRPRSIGLLFLFLLVIILFAYKYSFPSEPYYDEVYYVEFVRKLLFEHTYFLKSAHPPLWHLLTAACVWLWGDSSAMWRLISLLAGIAVVPVVYLLAKQLTHDPMTAGLAALFSVLDCLSLTQARIGMMNSLTLLLTLASLWAFLKYGHDGTWTRRKALFVTGIMFGLAISSKLAALGVVPVISVLLALRFRRAVQERAALIFDGLIFLVLLPILIFFLVHLFIAFLPGYSWRDIWAIQQFNFHYHTKTALTQTHTYASAWWGWPLILRPIWFYFQRNVEVVNGIMAIGNPLIFWAIPAVIGYWIYDLIRRRSAVAGILLLGFFGQWLLYAPTSRPVFFHYIYFAMPFLAIGLACICSELWKKSSSGKGAVIIYCVAVAAMFVYWYPLLTGMPISRAYFYQHMWFPSWI
jgi:dolichyl-phosphate-mannose--protein O-mannosyl transferase